MAPCVVLGGASGGISAPNLPAMTHPPGVTSIAPAGAFGFSMLQQPMQLQPDASMDDTPGAQSADQPSTSGGSIKQRASICASKRTRAINATDVPMGGGDDLGDPNAPKPVSSTFHGVTWWVGLGCCARMHVCSSGGGEGA